MSQVDLDQSIALLNAFVKETKRPLEVILIGGLAVQYYGLKDRATVDIDAEVKGDVEGLQDYLRENHIPADLGENISGWSVVAMPPGYRERIISIHQDEWLQVGVLDPVDFIIAKLRRFTEEDISDALFVAGKYHADPAEIRRAAEEAIRHSPKDTALFLFRGNLDLFLEKFQSSNH